MHSGPSAFGAPPPAWRVGAHGLPSPRLHFPAGGLGGRRNISLWSLNGAAAPAAVPVSRLKVWGGAAGYSAFDTTGGKVRLLYEGGNNIYDWGIKMSRVVL